MKNLKYKVGERIILKGGLREDDELTNIHWNDKMSYLIGKRITIIGIDQKWNGYRVLNDKIYFDFRYKQIDSKGRSYWIIAEEWIDEKMMKAMKIKEILK